MVLLLQAIVSMSLPDADWGWAVRRTPPTLNLMVAMAVSSELLLRLYPPHSLGLLPQPAARAPSYKRTSLFG